MSCPPQGQAPSLFATVHDIVTNNIATVVEDELREELGSEFSSTTALVVAKTLREQMIEQRIAALLASVGRG